jgi:hypothetical protein
LKKIILSLILLPLILILSLGFYLTTNGEVVHKIGKYVTSKYIKELSIDFDKINIEIESDSITKRKMQLSSEAQCIKYNPALVCLEKLLVVVKFDLLSPQNFIIEKLDLRINKARFIEGESKNSESTPLNIYEMYTKVYSLYRENRKMTPFVFHIEGSDILLNSDTSLRFLINKDNINLNLSSSSNNIQLGLTKTGLAPFEGELTITNQEMKILNTVLLSVGKTISLNLDTKLKIDTNNITTFVKLNLGEDLDLKLENTTFQLPDAKIKIKKCSFSITKSQSHLINCPQINLLVNKEPILEMNLEAYLKNIIDFENTKEVLQANITTKESQSNLFKLDLNASAKIDIEKSEFVPSLEEFKWKLIFDNFQKLVKKLEKSSFAIFAPFNTMDGKVQLESEKVIGVNNNGYTIPLKALIDLKDKEKNAIVLNFEGELRTMSDKKPKLTGALIVEEVRLNIPAIDPIGGIPNISGSSRVKIKIDSKKVKKKDVPLNYNIKVTTKTNESIKLYYYLLKPYLAFGLKANISNKATKYLIKGSKKVTISYLKRNLHLNSFTVSSKQDEKTEINLNSSYFTSGYRINLKIIGTLDKPKLILSSYPTLPREDILSLLIFKRKSNAISGSQRQSVGGTEAAIADKALGLFSIWAFASTPIEYVAYDPNTKSYSASIALPGNTSFKIGTDWESVSNLTLRKQLSETWAIETSYNPNDEEKSKNVMLQKEINF